MPTIITVNTLKVFVDRNRKFGNSVGIVVDEYSSLDKNKRLELTKQTGFSEVVFINNIRERNVSIFNPQEEVKFAGHALVGVSYFFRHRLKQDIKTIVCLNDIISTENTPLKAWVTAKRTLLTPWNLKKLDTVKAVLADDEGTKRLNHTMLWARDKVSKTIRARTFAPDWGIPEDEANGSGVMQLALLLKRDLTVIHGKGSFVYAKFIDDSLVAVGGRVKFSGQKILAI